MKYTITAQRLMEDVLDSTQKNADAPYVGMYKASIDLELLIRAANESGGNKSAINFLMPAPSEEDFENSTQVLLNVRGQIENFYSKQIDKYGLRTNNLSSIRIVEDISAIVSLLGLLLAGIDSISLHNPDKDYTRVKDTTLSSLSVFQAMLEKLKASIIRVELGVCLN